MEFSCPINWIVVLIHVLTICGLDFIFLKIFFQRHCFSYWNCNPVYSGACLQSPMLLWVPILCFFLLVFRTCDLMSHKPHGSQICKIEYKWGSWCYQIWLMLFIFYGCNLLLDIVLYIFCCPSNPWFNGKNIDMRASNDLTSTVDIGAHAWCR